jgi:hypothetical protein
MNEVNNEQPWESLENDLLTEKYTHVSLKRDDRGVPTKFHVCKVINDGRQVIGLDEVLLSEINFQSGAIKESGVNGVQNEDLICMVVSRLEAFQNSEFKCRENACAITKLEEALMWLRKRTIGRENRGVEGTHTV